MKAVVLEHSGGVSIACRAFSDVLSEFHSCVARWNLTSRLNSKQYPTLSKDDNTFTTHSTLISFFCFIQTVHRKKKVRGRENSSQIPR